MFVNSGRGSQFVQRIFRRAVWRVASDPVVVGDVVSFDLAGAGSSATQAGVGIDSDLGRAGLTANIGVINARFENLVQPAAANRDLIHGVVVDLLGGGGVQDSQVEVCVFGIVDAFIAFNGTAGDRVMGNTTYTTTAGRSLIALAVNADPLDFVPRGILLETRDGSSTRTLAKVLFNGLSGLFGTGGDQ